MLGTQSYDIPSFSDPDPGAPLSWNCVRNAPTVTMTDCTSGSITSLTVTPTIAEFGPHTVLFNLTDGLSYTQFTLTIQVINTPPYFETPFQTEYTAYLHSPSSYTLPVIKDD